MGPYDVSAYSYLPLDAAQPCPLGKGAPRRHQPATKQDKENTNVERATQNEAEPGSHFCLCDRLYTRARRISLHTNPAAMNIIKLQR